MLSKLKPYRLLIIFMVVLLLIYLYYSLYLTNNEVKVENTIKEEILDRFEDNMVNKDIPLSEPDLKGIDDVYDENGDNGDILSYEEYVEIYGETSYMDYLRNNGLKEEDDVSED